MRQSPSSAALKVEVITIEQSLMFMKDLSDGSKSSLEKLHMILL